MKHEPYTQRHNNKKSTTISILITVQGARAPTYARTQFNRVLFPRECTTASVCVCPLNCARTYIIYNIFVYADIMRTLYSHFVPETRTHPSTRTQAMLLCSHSSTHPRRRRRRRRNIIASGSVRPLACGTHSHNHAVRVFVFPPRVFT